MRLLVDAQLPPALARWLTAQGHDAQHLFEVELGDSPDSVVWMYALKEAAVIVTKDEDFAVWRLLHQGPAVVWLRLGNTRRAVLLARMEVELPAIVTALEKGDELIEIS